METPNEETTIMKRDTKIRAITRLIDLKTAEEKSEQAAELAASRCRHSVARQGAENAAGDAWDAARQAVAASEAWKSIAKPKREYATATRDAAIALATAAVRLGGRYSGGTTYSAGWGSRTTAGTATSRGEQYSRSCTYAKTDASHNVAITPEGIVDLLDAPTMAAASAADGLPLISYLASTGEAIWVEVKNKRLVAVRGWIAAAGSGIYHSEVSAEDAARGAARKDAAAVKAAARNAAGARADRRARLVVRLCRGATATVADALAAGFCQPGIRAWQERDGIGDEAPLADLVRTGDQMATRLAFDLARKVRREAVTA